MNGLVRELNPGPLAPEARIIPLDQQAAELESHQLKDYLLKIIYEKIAPTAKVWIRQGLSGN